MGHLLKFVKLYRKFINISETWHALRRNIAPTSLKNLYSVKSYDETNMKVSALSLRDGKKIWLGLNLF